MLDIFVMAKYTYLLTYISSKSRQRSFKISFTLIRLSINALRIFNHLWYVIALNF